MLLTKSTFISICVFGGIGKYLSNVVCSNGVSNSICAYFGLNLIFIISWNYYKYKYILFTRNPQSHRCRLQKSFTFKSALDAIAEHLRQALDEVYYGIKEPRQALDNAAAKSAKALGW
jgi:hypothetical protein